ncbi:hypothetical protein HRG_005908 [Hirsutella rhossiliensis]|uniref:Uncharacterized protein n=1 Tax=Hirsutella rhossiliensis TaxID=111463 RepID=A0A9P8MW89_9HYPO|nr:uncharacterized protein HRG_05908 [Hirsutella rhossiliensis]KAH0963398.1 hypothetical protein HRG_05908 [Hirsutella rhossiliensis]
MRGALAVKRLPGVTALSGRRRRLSLSVAESLPISPSFHWFAHKQALEEIHRVLKWRGKLGMIWNGQPTGKWTAATRWEQQRKELILKLDPAGPPRFRDDKWWHVLERQSRAAKPIFSTPMGEKKKGTSRNG